jgi:DNA polymerase-3 subunit beta
MEVHVDRDAFSRGLQMVQNIVEPRQTLPILANVLLHADGEKVTVTATDLEVGARVSMPAKVLVSGSITLPARKLAEIVKELTSAPVAFRVQDNAWVSIRCAGASYRLVGLAPEDFPPVTEGATTAWVRLDGTALKDMLARTSFAMSHDESRYALNGVLLVLGEKDVRVVATDGHRLALASRPVGAGGVPATGIVPRKAVHEVERILGAGEDVEIAISDNQFMLRMPNVLVVARLIEGTFPNFEQVIPRGQPHRLLVGRQALIAALRRVSVLSEERTRPVKVTVGQGVLRLSAYHPDFGEAEEALEVDYQGEEVSIGFNSRYLLDALGAQGDEQSVFEFKDGLSPGVVRSLEDEGSICVIMPMRI